MDGVHDLGGREGFGPIRNKDEDRPFQEEWETRAFGMIQSAAGETDWSIDWFRHCRELLVPVDYLGRSYFDQWVVTLAAQMIDAGYVTIDELKSGVSAFKPHPGFPPDTAAGARAYVEDPRSYARRIASPPAHFEGETVRARMSGHSGHTRLPGYVRGRTGIVVAHHGAHVLPDASARGEEAAAHLYTVSFAASELWPEARQRPDRVFVDLWEDYLEPA